jgi:hypothetical protein
MGRSQQIKYLRVYLTWVVHSNLSIYVCILMFSFLKLNKRVSNITNGLRFCRPLPWKFLYKKCHIYIDTIEWKYISALDSTE